MQRGKIIFIAIGSLAFVMVGLGAYHSSKKDVGASINPETSKPDGSQENMNAKPEVALARRLRGTSSATGSNPYQRFVLRFLVQFVFGIFFWCVVSGNYTSSRNIQKNKDSNMIMSEGTTCRCSENSSIFCLGVFCLPAQFAHVVSKLGIMEYPAAIILSSCFPLCATVGLTCYEAEVEAKLGGNQTWSNIMIALCCPACLMCQLNDALDAASGEDTGLCSVTKSSRPLSEPFVPEYMKVQAAADMERRVADMESRANMLNKGNQVGHQLTGIEIAKKGFLEACRKEYVHGALGSVANFLSSNDSMSVDRTREFDDIRRFIRESPDPKKMIDALENMESSNPKEMIDALKKM